MPLRQLAFLTFAVSFICPAAEAPTGQILFGFELFLQGLIGSFFILPVSIFHLELGAAILILPWIGNPLFIGVLLMRRHLSMRGAVLATLCAVIMGLYFIFPVANYDGSGTSSLPVEPLFGVYLWMVSPIILLINILITNRRSSGSWQ